MYFVYIIESGNSQHWYVGMTENIERRLMEHNDGRSTHTKKYAHWRLKSYVAFSDKKQALRFERYLKSHSGRAFSIKRL